jgi:hypothetical protein
MCPAVSTPIAKPVINAPNKRAEFGIVAERNNSLVSTASVFCKTTITTIRTTPAMPTIFNLLTLSFNVTSLAVPVNRVGIGVVGNSALKTRNNSAFGTLGACFLGVYFLTVYFPRRSVLSVSFIVSLVESNKSKPCPSPSPSSKPPPFSVGGLLLSRLSIRRGGGCL